ncbi:MAG: hypothetical protein ACYC67_10470 [Prosthecobacter sp.]
MSAPVTNIGNVAVAFGTVEIGTTFGQVESASLEATIEELGVPDNFGGFQGYLLINPGFKLQFSAIFPTTAELPVHGEPIAFPAAGVVGNVINYTVNWEQKGNRKITVQAQQWASIGSNPVVGTLVAGA